MEVNTITTAGERLMQYIHLRRFMDIALVSLLNDLMEFKNNLIAPDDFPKYEAVATTRIHPNYWKVIQWRFFIALIILAGIVALFYWIPGLQAARWYVTVGFALIVVLLYFLQKTAFGRRSYAIREHDVIYRHGILSVVTTIIPFNRIQHVSVLEGLIPRKYGVATLGIYTAGGSSADLKIAGLPADIAYALKDIILRKIKNETNASGA